MNLRAAYFSAENLSEDVVELLQEMGLSPKEVQIYEYLLNVGSATPSTIARETAQPRGRIYEGMRNLVIKGFARERPTRPIQFCPTPLPSVLTAAQARLSRHLLAVRRGQAAAARRLPTGDGPARPMRIRDVSVVSGRRACQAEILRMIETATTSFWLAGGGRFADRLAKMQGLLDVARAASDRGVDVRIFFPRPLALARTLALADAGQARPILHQLPSDPFGPFVACATENASFELRPQPDDEVTHRGDDVAIHVQDEVFAQRLRRRLEALSAVPHAAHTAPAQPEPAFDPSADPLLDAVRFANHQVRVLGPAEWMCYMATTWAENAEPYADAARRGVELKAVATEGAALDPLFHKIQTAWQVRCVDRVDLWLTITDGRQLLQAFSDPSQPGPPRFRTSTEPQEIRFYESIFARLWEQARLPKVVVEAPTLGPNVDAGSDRA